MSIFYANGRNSIITSTFTYLGRYSFQLYLGGRVDMIIELRIRIF
jgi:hypothetical protein